MPQIDRRFVLSALAASGAQAVVPSFAFAQQGAVQPPPPHFGYEDVVKRARELAAAPFDALPPKLPDGLDKLDFDAWRDIRFRPEKALLGAGGGPFRLETFHLGHLYPRPVVVNTIRDGIATPIPYSPNMFDYGRNKFDRSLPVNLGFAGFRLHYPLNDPRVYDEVIAFLGASYFRFLGRGQRYGLSARALTVVAGTNEEEFPFFREFWVETPPQKAERATIYGLLDGASIAGAYRFDIYPGVDTALEVSATLFARRPGLRLGLAPLTSMFDLGENNRRMNTDYRPELHDSDGLLMHSGAGEWIWRPLRNPLQAATSAFVDKDCHGFGLLQRDRQFEHYQDIDLAYQLRPSYWVEPHESWGEGHVELIELPTANETNDNIVALWAPKDSPEPGKAFSYSYKMTASLDLTNISPNGRVANTYQTLARALGSNEPMLDGTRRFMIDFAGGDLPFYLVDPSMVELVASASQGRVLRTILTPNPYAKGFRAMVDVQVDPGQTSDVRAFLRTSQRTLTETWTFPWKAE